MFVHLSIHHPRPSREQDLADSMRAVVKDDPFEEWEEREPEVFTLVDVWRSP